MAWSAVQNKYGSINARKYCVRTRNFLGKNDLTISRHESRNFTSGKILEKKDRFFHTFSLPQKKTAYQ